MITRRHALGAIAGVTLPGCVPTFSQAEGFPRNADRATFVYSDIDLFWAAFDQVLADQNATLSSYIENGSPGVADFVATARIDPATFTTFVRSEQAYYLFVRESSHQARRYEPAIRRAYRQFDEIYTDARFAPTYYVIGQTYSGGTASDHGMIIGLETFSVEPTRTSYGRPTTPLDHLPYVAAHELMHFQQAPLPDNATLLQRVIHEGGADFVAELISGPEVKLLNGPNVYSFGDEHFDMLWQEFLAQRHNQEDGVWLYARTQGRPQNLGYWVGYRIASGYYERARDKRRAIADIIRFGDGERLLQQSGLPAAPP